MESIILLVLGLLVVVIGVVNMTGNISTVHAYNRRKVREEDVPKYGRAVGLGTLIIGIGLIVDFVLTLLELPWAIPFVIIPAVVVGLGLILYAQFKYNRGIF